KYLYETLVEELEIYFKLTVKEGGNATFSYSNDGKNFHPFGVSFQARQGKWIGAKTGLFILNKTIGTSRSWMDADWFKVEK
ncbi:MAG: glycoside hydrolase, partial [Prevotellaceae bacterium]|nr:glycoside hydrolase [Prevotellaceae bacterium]